MERTRSLTDEEMDAALTNICRCGIYPRLREAVRTPGAPRRVGLGPTAAEGSPPATVPRDLSRPEKMQRLASVSSTAHPAAPHLVSLAVRMFRPHERSS
jgi:hypothetical protein